MVVAVTAVEVVAASMAAVVEAVGFTVVAAVAAALITAEEAATALLVAAQTIIPARRITIPVLPDPTVHTAAAQRIPIARPDATATLTTQATAQA